MLVSLVLAGIGDQFVVRCRWMTFGGISDVGRSFIPSSKRAYDAILMQLVDVLYHSMFLVVSGTNPRKIPLRELFWSLADLRPGGRTQTREPNVLKFRRFSRLPVASSIGDLDWVREEIALRIRRE